MRTKHLVGENILKNMSDKGMLCKNMLKASKTQQY